MGLLASDTGLRRTTLPQKNPDECLRLLCLRQQSAIRDPVRFSPLTLKINGYFSGAPVVLACERMDIVDVGLFTREVWHVCRSIPVGETRSYSWLAAKVGVPRGARAVGQAMARNLLPIVIPCHRVVSKNGKLGGFGSKSSMVGLKRRLLELEMSGVTAPKSHNVS